MAHHITVSGSSWCSDCKRAKRFLGDQQVKYKWIDVEQNEEGRTFVDPLSFETWRRVAVANAFAEPRLLDAEPSRFLRRIYSAATTG